MDIEKKLKSNDPLLFENIVECQGYFWFTEFRFNALYRVKADSTEAEFMGRFPAESDKGRLFVQVKAYKGILIFVPLTAASVVLYDIQKAEFINLPLCEPDGQFIKLKKYDENSKFRTCERVDNCVYFFPSTYPAVLKLDLETFKLEYLYESISKISLVNSDVMYFKNSMLKGDKVLLWCICANSLLEFDLNTQNFEVLYHEASDVIYTDAIVNKKDIWLLPYYSENTVRRITFDTKEAVDVAIPKDVLSGNYQFVSGLILNNDLWLFPGTANSVLVINCDTCEVKKAEEINSRINFDCEYYQKNSWKFFFAYAKENYLFLYNYYSCSILKYNMLDGKIIKEWHITQGGYASNAAKATMMEYCIGEWKANRVVNEEARVTLEDYLDYISKN